MGSRRSLATKPGRRLRPMSSATCASRRGRASGLGRGLFAGVAIDGAVIRADNTPIHLGEETNFQDGAVGHSDPGAPLTIGARVTVGHQAILHGCTISDYCLIGMGARILNHAFLGPECLVGAGALITEGKRFEEGGLIVGSPARLVRPLTDAEKAVMRLSAAHYAEKAARYASGLRLLR